jgi:hypothetical protein
MRSTLKLAVFRIAALTSIFVACGGSQTSPKLDALAQQSLDDPSQAPAYDAGAVSISDFDAEVDASADDPNATTDVDPNVAAPIDDVEQFNVVPSIAESDVRVGLDIFLSDDASFVAAIDKRVAPGRVADTPFFQDFKTPVPKDSFAFRPLSFPVDSKKVVYTLRNHGHAAGLVLPLSENRQIIPVDWLRAVIAFKDADEKLSRAWYVAMSQRLAVAGRACGILIFDNGTAAGVNIEAHGESENDLVVVARTKFFPVDGFDASAWGPSVQNVKGVVTKNGDGHLGIDSRDLLSQALHVTLPPHQY